jgi:iron complex outermembrane receptor protein
LRTSRDLDAYRIANKTTLRDGRNTYEIALYALQQDLYHPTSMSHIEQVANTYGGHIKWLQSNELFGLPNQMQIAFMPSTGKTKSNSWSYVSVSAPFNPAKSSQTGRALQDSDNQSWLVENRTKVNSNTSIVSSLQYEYARRKITDPLATSSNYDRTYDAWLPRLGFTHDISSQQQIFGNISRNFEAPIFGVASDMQASQAQTGTTYELGARGDARYKEINSLIGWDITVYRADLRNEFQTTCSSTVSCSGGAITRNIPRTLHQGVEAGIYSLTKNHYETRTSLLISDFRFQDNALYGDNRMPGFPPLLLRSEFLYRWGPSFGVTGLPANYLGPKIEWASKAPIDNRNTQHNEAYFLLGFKAGQQLDRSWSWFLDGRNLTDKKYAATTGVYATNLSASTAAYLPGDGRSFYFGLEKKWD